MHGLLGYALDAGVDARWLVIQGSPDFFVLTKRLHNRIHGSEGDHGPLGHEEHELYRSTLARELDDLRSHIRPGDVVVLHDPQPAGLAEAVRAAGAQLVWRCHIGSDTRTDLSESAWGVPPALPRAVRPALGLQPPDVPTRLGSPGCHDDGGADDRPVLPKNQDLEPEVIESILTHVGLIGGSETTTTFHSSAARPHGSSGTAT